MVRRKPRPTPTLPDREWLTAREAADYLGVSDRTLHKMREKGLIRANRGEKVPTWP